MNFKVGDKVRILDGSNIKDYTGIWVKTENGVKGMDVYVGKVATITKKVFFSSGAVGDRVKENGYTWDGRGLEFVDEYETVGIERHRDKISAKRGNVVGAATFQGSYSEAAISALRSLIRKEKIRKFHKGDLVRYAREDGYLKVGTVGKIVEVDKGDTAMPFYVKFDNYGAYWVELDDIEI